MSYSASKKSSAEARSGSMAAWRGLATRYDKQAIVYRGGVVAAVLLWLTDLGDTS